MEYGVILLVTGMVVGGGLLWVRWSLDASVERMNSQPIIMPRDDMVTVELVKELLGNQEEMFLRVAEVVSTASRETSKAIGETLTAALTPILQPVQQMPSFEEVVGQLMAERETEKDTLAPEHERDPWVDVDLNQAGE